MQEPISNNNELKNNIISIRNSSDNKIISLLHKKPSHEVFIVDFISIYEETVEELKLLIENRGKPDTS